MVPSPLVETVTRWVQLHHAALYRYAFRLTGSTSDAEDLTQQTFLAALEHGASVRDEERVRGWLYTVLRHRFWKQRRRRQPVVGKSELDWSDLPDRVQPDGADGDLFAQLPFDQATLQTTLQQLPDSSRLVLLMFYFEELSYREIAAQLEIPLGTVMSRLSRAKEHLRNRLAEVAEEDDPTWPAAPVGWRGATPAVGS